MCPPETVVAEMCEAEVTLGMANGRMKNFYDLLVIFRSYTMSEDSLAQAIATTFGRRPTELRSYSRV